jgi:uncharacterized protein
MKGDRLTTISRGRSLAWAGLAAAMAALAYAANVGSSGRPDDDALFQWATALSAAIIYAIIAAVLLTIIEPLDRHLIGFRRPVSWSRAGGLIVAGFVTIAVAGVILSQAGLDAGDEQGLVPKDWQPGRAAPFIANFVVVAIVAPVVEELMFRGAGFAVIRQFAGPAVAVAGTALLFGLAHGLVVALPVLVAFGAVLAVVRWKTESVYPPMILHGIFNALALIAGVAGIGA